MSTLLEIEAAADLLPANQKQELLLFLAEKLRGSEIVPPQPRDISGEQIAEWIKQDEMDLIEFRQRA